MVRLTRHADRVRPRADQVHGVLVCVRCQQPAPLPVPAQLGEQVVSVLGAAIDLQQQRQHPGRRRLHHQVRPLDVPVAKPVTDLGGEAEPVPVPSAVEFGGRGGDRRGVSRASACHMPPGSPYRVGVSVLSGLLRLMAVFRLMASEHLSTPWPARSTRRGPRQPPQPARLERWTVGRDMPHGTGVESVIHTVSIQKSLSMASSRIMRLTNGRAARRRLLYPDCCGRYGNRPARRLRANRSHRASEW
jgi:hypothetical protein